MTLSYASTVVKGSACVVAAVKSVSLLWCGVCISDTAVGPKCAPMHPLALHDGGEPPSEIIRARERIFDNGSHSAKLAPTNHCCGPGFVSSMFYETDFIYSPLSFEVPRLFCSATPP